MTGSSTAREAFTMRIRRAARTAGRALPGGLRSMLIAGVLLMLPGSAVAEFGLQSFDGEVVNVDGGVPVAATQAGSHPDEASATIVFNQLPHPVVGLTSDGSIKDVEVDLPAGFVGNPTAAPKCTDAELTDPIGIRCPRDSQVGIVTIQNSLFPPVVSVYNMVPPPGVPGAFGFRVGGVVTVHLRARVRSESDYGLSIDISDINQAVPILGTKLTLWGVPADASHDLWRNCTSPDLNPCGPPGFPTLAERKAFLTNPTSCDGPVETRLRVTSWRDEVDRASFVSHLTPPQERTLVGPDGCDKLQFNVSMTAKPSTTRASSPTGFEFDINVPQSDDPDSLAQAHLKKAVVRLPEGVSVSPAAAAGLEACSDSRSGVGTTNDPDCPEASKIGRMTVDTPLLAEVMKGSIYLAEPKPGNLFRLLLVAKGPGVVIKLPGTVRPDPKTGQLTATFDNNPQLPFSNLHLEFKTGPRAPLSNPRACGVYTTTGTFTAWSGKQTTSNSDFELTSDSNGARCAPKGFTPAFAAGLSNPVAGSSSAFSLTFSRDDEDQTLRDITVAMPEGLTGMISNATLCTEPQASAGTCGEGSRVGSTTTGAGAGSNPFFVPGRVYITGPYKGAPFGLSIVVPVIAGPFDLGVITVRAAIHVDRTTAQLRVIADPLPTILEGVPLLVRTVNIRIDKPGFMLAPTSCNPKSIAAQVGANEGGSAAVSSRFQVGSCAALPFKPKLALRIGGKGYTRAESTAPFQATLTMPRGAQSNVRSVAVTLPANVNSRLAALRGACSVEAARARSCGRGAIVGSAVAVTPLLRDPLTGPVYIVRTRGNRLPDLWVALKGQVEFDLIGRVKIVGKRLQLRTTFAEVPDVPVSMFRLNFIPGRNAVIGLVRGVCTASVRRGMVANLALRGQNGRLVARDQQLQVAGCARRPAGRRATGRSSTPRR